MTTNQAPGHRPGSPSSPVENLLPIPADPSATACTSLSAVPAAVLPGQTVAGERLVRPRRIAPRPEGIADLRCWVMLLGLGAASLPPPATGGGGINVAARIIASDPSLVDRVTLSAEARAMCRRMKNTAAMKNT